MLQGLPAHDAFNTAVCNAVGCNEPGTAARSTETNKAFCSYTFVCTPSVTHGHADIMGRDSTITLTQLAAQVAVCMCIMHSQKGAHAFS